MLAFNMPSVLVPVRRLTRAVSVLLALLAMLAKAASGGMLPPPPASVPDVTVLGVICHAPAANPERPAPHHQPTDCEVCPLCLSASLSADIPVPGPVPMPAIRTLGRVMALPPARAPPGQTFSAAWPRGPPGTV